MVALGRWHRLAWLVVVALTLGAQLSAAQCKPPSSRQAKSFKKCKYLIIGGGPGGLYSAYQLRRFGSNVCVIEREQYTGGKMQDIEGPYVPGKKLGTCGLRINENQPEMRCLANEINITLQESNFETVYYSRGSWQRATSGFIEDGLFNLQFQPDVEDPEVALTEYALLGTRAANPITGEVPAVSPLKRCMDYPSVSAYLRDVVGPEGYAFMLASEVFKGHMEMEVDVCLYIQYYKVDWKRCCINFYIEGGFSAFWARVKSIADAAGVRFFLGTEAKCINKVPKKVSALPYQVTTNRRGGFSAERLIMNIPPQFFAKIGGNIPARIMPSPFLQSIQPHSTIIYQAFYPRRFWEEPNANGVQQLDSGSNFRVMTDSQCLHRSEYLGAPYLKDSNGTRPVYVDRPTCLADWNNAYASGGVDAVTDLVHKQLEQHFVGVDIPQPIKTFFQYKELAWCYMKPYTTKKYGITAETMIEWAATPLAGEKLCFAGENYNIEYAGWSHGAQLSAINCLKAHFSDVLPLPAINSHVTCGGKKAPFPNEMYVDPLPSSAGGSAAAAVARSAEGKLPPTGVWRT